MSEVVTANEEETIVGPLREKFDGEIAYWKVKGFGLVVCAGPENPKQFQVLVNQLKDEKRDSAIDLENYAVACVVYPTDKEAVRAIFRKKPAFALTVAKRAQDLAGADIAELGKD